MELKKNVKHEHLPFFQQDIHNLYVKMRKMHAMNDAMDLLQFCKVAKERNSKFQYAFTTDEEKRLKWRKRLVLPQMVQKKGKHVLQVKWD